MVWKIYEVYSAFKFVGNGTQIAQNIRKAVLIEPRADDVVQACCLRHSYLSPGNPGNKSKWNRNNLLLERIDRDFSVVAFD